MIIKRALILIVFLLWAIPSLASEDYLIADITVTGNQRIKADTILNAISLHKGQLVSHQQIDDAIQAIYRLGRFSDVAALVEVQNNAQVLVFQVKERPLVRTVRFDGNEEIRITSYNVCYTKLLRYQTLSLYEIQFSQNQSDTSLQLS